jgi:Holliday junction resolvase
MEKNNIIKNIERRIKEIAKDYESKGYSVIISPNQSQLPDFLKGFEPDLLVQGESESVVIEVKSTKGNTSQLKHYESLAKTIAEHKGWRFELVFTNPIEQTISTNFSIELSLEKIRQRLDEVNSLMISNHYEAAFLLAWTTLEAIKTVYSLGYVNSHDYKKLERLNQRRNLLIHGFDSPIDKNSIDELLNIVSYVIGDSKEVVMYNFLETLDLEDYEEIYQLHTTVRYKKGYGAFTYTESQGITIGCTYNDEKLFLEGENEERQFLSLIEQEYMDDMDAESWYGFKRAMEKDD